MIVLQTIAFLLVLTIFVVGVMACIFVMVAVVRLIGREADCMINELIDEFKTQPGEEGGES